MREDQLRDLLRTLEETREPQPAFADELYGHLRNAASDERPRVAFLLLAAALLVVLAAGLAIGSGRLPLPVTVEATPATSPSEPAEPSSSRAAPTPTPDPGIAGRILAVMAPEVALRSGPDAESEQLGILRTGQRAGAVDGPVSADGMDWYEVRIGAGDVGGWVTAGPDGDALALVEDGLIAASCVGDACPDGSGVYLATLEDGLGTKIADQPMWVGVWSPDGTRLAVTDAGGASPGTVILLGPDGAPLGPGLAVDDVPSWSPDGSRLAWSTGDTLVVTDTDFVPMELVRMDATVRSPTWSPDGTRLAFVQRPCPECDRSGRGRPPGTLWMIDADGANLRPLDSVTTDGVDWPPDGRYVALSESGDDQIGAKLYLLSVKDPRRTPAIAEDLVPGWAMWSPDGAMLAYTTRAGMVVANGDGNDARLLVALPRAAGSIPQFRWAPSGRSLLVESVDQSGRVSISVVDVETGASRDVLPGAPYLTVLQWQPVLVPLP